MSVADVISLLGGIALFLFGMSLMGEGLKKVAGSRLELVLYKLSSTPLKGVLLGTGVTAVIQSSSATSVMVVGFVNSGMMKVKQAIGVIMGAILGTSVTGWILCLSSLEGGSGVVQLLSTEVLTGIVAVVGIILRMFTGKTSNRYVGEILLGFAVLMYGMSAMSGAVSPLRESEAFIRILTSFSNPILGILVGLAFTSVLQSASAAVDFESTTSTNSITPADITRTLYRKWPAIARQIYPPKALTPNRLKPPMMAPARRTPAAQARVLFLKSISSRLAARVPVQAPVPGRGIPTNSSSAQYSPRPALAWSLRPAFSPFSRQKVKNFPIYLLSFPHTSTFRAKK